MSIEIENVKRVKAVKIEPKKPIESKWKAGEF